MLSAGRRPLQTWLQSPPSFASRTRRMARVWVCVGGAVFFLSCLVLHWRFSDPLVNSGDEAVGCRGRQGVQPQRHQTCSWGSAAGPSPSLLVLKSMRVGEVARRGAAVESFCTGLGIDSHHQHDCLLPHCHSRSRGPDALSGLCESKVHINYLGLTQYV